MEFSQVGDGYLRDASYLSRTGQEGATRKFPGLEVGDGGGKGHEQGDPDYIDSGTPAAISCA